MLSDASQWIGTFGITAREERKPDCPTDEHQHAGSSLTSFAWWLDWFQNREHLGNANINKGTQLKVTVRNGAKCTNKHWARSIWMARDRFLDATAILRSIFSRYRVRRDLIKISHQLAHWCHLISAVDESLNLHSHDFHRPFKTFRRNRRFVK